MKLNKEQLIELFEIVKTEVQLHSFYRLGQSFFNNLVDKYPEFDSQIRGSNIDCFYTNWKIIDVVNLICDSDAIEYFKTTNIYNSLLENYIQPKQESTQKIKLQYAVVILREFTYEDKYDINDTYHTTLECMSEIEWFDKEDDAIFSFAKINSGLDRFPDNMVIKKVVKI